MEKGEDELEKAVTTSTGTHSAAKPRTVNQYTHLRWIIELWTYSALCF